jgi:hypothetical protein
MVRCRSFTGESDHPTTYLENRSRMTARNSSLLRDELGCVAHSLLVRPVRLEVGAEEVGHNRLVVVAVPRALGPLADARFQALLLHEPSTVTGKASFGATIGINEVAFSATRYASPSAARSLRRAAPRHPPHGTHDDSRRSSRTQRARHEADRV